MESQSGLRQLDERAPDARRAVRPEAASPGRAPGPVRIALAIVGTVALAVGVIGIFVPLLPTTPFLLLAAACYARASGRLYAWLLGQPSLGPIITEWRASRSLPAGVRGRALVLVVLTFGVSIVLVEEAALRVGLVTTGLVLLGFLMRIPSRS